MIPPCSHPPNPPPQKDNQNWIVLISPFQIFKLYDVSLPPGSFIAPALCVLVSSYPLACHGISSSHPSLCMAPKGPVGHVCSAILEKDSWPGLLWPFLCLCGSSVGSGHPSWHTQGTQSRHPMNSSVGNIGHLSVWQAEEDDFSPFAYTLHLKCAWMASSQSSGRSGDSLKINGLEGKK